MFQVFKDMWHDLSKTGRAVVIVVMLLAVAGLLAMAMWFKYDLSWIPGLLGSQAQG